MTCPTPRIRPLALVLGIGTPLARALADSLARRDTDLLLVDPDGERLLAMRESLGTVMVHVQLFQCDLAEAAQRRELLRFLSVAGSKPDLLLFLPDAELEEKALEAAPAQARRLQEAHLTALDELLRSGILTHMRIEDNGYVLAAVPESALGLPAGQALQSACAASLIRYLLNLSAEFQRSGVGFTVACCPPESLRRDAGGPASDMRGVSERVLRALFARKPWVGGRSRWGWGSGRRAWWRF